MTTFSIMFQIFNGIERRAMERQPTTITATELFNALKPETDLRIAFDDHRTDRFGNKLMRILTVKSIKDGKVVGTYDMEEVFAIKGIHPWFSCGKQLRRSTEPFKEGTSLSRY